MHEIAGYNTVNPLYTLWQLFNSAGYENLTIEDVIRWFNKPPLDIKAMMIDFAARGFIEYDVNHNQIRYRSKIAQYLNNQVKKKDYDYIKLESKTHYASLDLATNDLKITGGGICPQGRSPAPADDDQGCGPDAPLGLF